MDGGVVTSQPALLDVGARPAKPPWSCPTCGGTKKKAGRCKPCVVEPPKPTGTTGKKWISGILRVVRTRLAHLPDRVVMETWEALLLDSRPIPEEARVLVADVAALPFSAKRYQRALDRALCASQLLGILAELGVRREADDQRDPQRDIASLAARRIFEERDRLDVADLGGRRTADILWRCIFEHRARKRLARTGLKGAALERAVIAEADRDEAAIETDLARTSRVGTGLRIEAPAVHVDDGAEEEAAEIESAEAARKGRKA